MTYVFKLTENQFEKFHEYYSDFAVPVTTQYMKSMYKQPDLTVTVFDTLKVSLQGEGAKDEYLMWSEILGFTPQFEEEKPGKPLNVGSYSFLNESTIGSDEVGTGDFYGPVVVCSCFIDKSNVNKVIDLGVMDSKKLTDPKIQEIAKRILPYVKYQLLIVPNPKYNQLVKEGYNQNKMKAYLHNHAILKLEQSLNQKADRIILDQFCSEKNYFEYLAGKEIEKNISFYEKAESISVSVAAASILARDAFLKEMDQLSKSLGFELPKGASVIVDLIGKRIALEKGLDYFDQIAKTHFKNFDKIKDMLANK